MAQKSAGSGIYNIIPVDISVATAYKFKIEIYYDIGDPTLYVELPSYPFELIVGCL